MPSIPGIDQGQILQWVDIGLWILLGTLLLGMLIAFFRGLLRGWKQGTYRFIFLSAILVTLLLLMPVWVNIVGNLPLGNWIKEPIRFEAEGTEVVVPVTTAFETAYNLIKSVLTDVFHVRASVEAVIAYSIALAGSLIRLVIVFLAAFLTSTIGSFLSWLLWHLLFKRFMKKENRKPKLRWISGLEEAVVWFGLLGVMIVPFSGIANAIHNNAVLPEDESNETLTMINKVIDSYDKSVFNKIFFEWTKGSGNKTLDTQLAEFFAQNSYKTPSEYEAQANFVKEFSVLAALEGNVVQWLFDSPEGDSSAVSAILSTAERIGFTLYSWALESPDNLLMNALVPLTLDLGANIDAVAADFAADAELWLEDGHNPARLAQLKKSYARVSKSDYVSAVDDVFQGDYAVPLYDRSCPYPDAYLDLVREQIAESPERRKMVNAAVSGYVLGQMETNPSWQEGNGVMPNLAKALADKESVLSVDWWQEANLLYDVHTQLEVLAADDTSMDSMTEKLIKSFSEALARDPYGLIEIFIGKRDDAGEPVVDALGNNPQKLCLLDSDLITALLPILIEVGTDYVDQEVLTDPEDQDTHDAAADVVAELVGASSKETRIAFKRELGHILDIPGKIALSEAGKLFIKDFQNHPGIEISEEGVLLHFDSQIAEGVMAGLREIDKSKLMSEIGVPVAEHFLRPQLANDGALGKLGITEVALYKDYEGKRIKLGEELAKFLSVGVYCNDIVPVIGALLGQSDQVTMDMGSFLESLFELEDEDSNYQLTHLLDILLGSKILNPDIKEGDKVVHNTNLRGVVETLLSSTSSEFDLSIDPSIWDDAKLPSEWHGAKIGTERGEIFYMMQCVKSLVDSNVLSIMGGSMDASSLMPFLAGLPIEEIFTSIGHSLIMRNVGSSLFDTLLLKTLFGAAGYDDLVASGVTYKNLTTAEDWAAEGSAIKSIIDLAYRGLDISNLDFFKPSTVDMLAKLARSGMFFSAFDEEGNPREEKEYVFPRFLKDKLLMNLSTASMVELFLDYPDKVVDGKTVGERFAEVSDWHDLLDVKQLLCSNFCRSIDLLKTPEQWQDEFNAMKNIVLTLSAAGGMDALSGGIDADKIPMITRAVHFLGQSQAFGPTLLSNIIHVALKSNLLPDQFNDVKINEGFLFANAEAIIEGRENGEDVDALCTLRDHEIQSILDLVDIVSGQASIEMNIATLDVDGLLRPLLQTCSTSRMLNPAEATDMYPGEALPGTTAFEAIVGKIMAQSGIYNDHDGNKISATNVPVQGSSYTIEQIVNLVPTETTWPEEINAICDLIQTIQGSSFIGEDGDFDLSGISHIDTYFAHSGSHEELQYLMNSLQHSQTFYRVIPPMLDKAVRDGLGSLNLKFIADDMSCADFFYTSYEKDAITDFLPYEEAEVNRLIDILDYLSPCMRLNLTDLSTLDVDSLSNAITSMAASKIFNTNTAKSALIDKPLWTEERKGATAFQLLCADIISVDALADYMYLDASPKDTANVAAGKYAANASDKQVYLVRSLLPAMKLDGSNAAAVVSAASRVMGEEWGDCLRVLQSSTFEEFFGSGSVGIQDLSEDNLAMLLHALNDCTLYRDCVPNAFYKTINETDALQDLTDIGVKLENSDFFFSYYCHDGAGKFSPSHNPTPNFDMPFYSPEIDQIAMLFSILKDDSSMLSNPSLDSVEAEKLRAILYDVHDSYAMHLSRFVDLNDEGELSIFQQFIRVFLDKSKLYDGALDGEHKVQHTNLTLDGIVLKILDNQWADEIENLYDLLLHLQSSNTFVDGTGKLDLSVISNLDTFFPAGEDATREANKQELVDLMTYVERGRVLYRALPSRMESALNSAFDGADPSSLFGKLQKDLACADFYCTAVGVEDFEPYSHDLRSAAVEHNEVQSLVDIFEDIAIVKNANLSDLSTVDEGRLKDVMEKMGINRIFNSDTTKSVTEFASTNTERQGLTAHQAVLCDAIYVDKLKDYMLNAASPKDGALGVADSDHKIAHVIPSMIPALDKALPFAAMVDGYLTIASPVLENWKDTLTNLKSDPTLTGFLSGSSTLTDLTGAGLAGMLKILNDSDFYYDAVPNAIQEALVNNAAFGGIGIDFASSDVYFSYYYDSSELGLSGSRGTPVYTRRFYEPEIDQIGDIYDDLNTNKTLFETIEMNNPALGVALNNTLDDLRNSYIFHMAAKDDRRAVALSGNNFQDLTVFEQLIFKFIHDTSLDQSGYNALADYSFALEGGANGHMYKLHKNILDITTDRNDFWLDEIKALTTDGLDHAGNDADPYIGIIAAGQNSGIFSDPSSSVNVDFDSLKSLSPAKIKSLLYSINGSALLSDVLPNTISTLMGGDSFGLNQFSIGSKTLSGYTGELQIEVNATATPWIFEKTGATTYGNFHGLTSISFPVTDPTDHFHVTTLDDENITGLVAMEYDAGTATFNVANFPKAFRLTLDAGYAIGGDVTFTYDYAVFRQGQQQFRDTGIRALGYLLSSMYRGNAHAPDAYYTFDSSGDGLNDFFDDPSSDYTHSTYGLLSFFGDSGFYGSFLNEDGDFLAEKDVDGYDAAAYTFYHALTFQAEAGVTIDLGGGNSLSPSGTISISKYIGQGAEPKDDMHAIAEIFGKDDYALDAEHYGNYVREAKWFDSFAASAGTLDVYNGFLKIITEQDAVDMPAPMLPLDISSGETKYTITQLIDRAFASDGDAMNSIRKLLDGWTYDYDITVANEDEVGKVDTKTYSETGVGSEFGRAILRGTMEALAEAKSETIGIDYAAKYYEAVDSASKKSTRIDSLATDALYGAGEALLGESYLAETKNLFTAMQLLRKGSLTSDEKTNLKTIFNGFDATRNQMIDLFYLASLYEPLGALGLSGNNFFHIAVLPLIPRVDFPSVKAGATGFDKTGAVTDFSYAAVADCIV